jgi:putative FmdB family regulatory protein
VPTYQYTCTDCGDQLEAVQKFTDSPLSVCVACGGRLRKVFSPVGIVFKGSGFYRTDSRNGPASSSAAAKDKPVATPAEAGSGPADKPAAGNGPADKPAAGKAAETAGASSKSPAKSASGEKAA